VTPIDSGLGAGAQALGTSLAVGLLIGLERGWRDRERPDGGRVAGLRTFTLIGLTGAHDLTAKFVDASLLRRRSGYSPTSKRF